MNESYELFVKAKCLCILIFCRPLHFDSMQAKPLNIFHPKTCKNWFFLCIFGIFIISISNQSKLQRLYASFQFDRFFIGTFLWTASTAIYKLQICEAKRADSDISVPTYIRTSSIHEIMEINLRLCSNASKSWTVKSDQCMIFGWVQKYVCLKFSFFLFIESLIWSGFPFTNNLLWQIEISDAWKNSLIHLSK